MRMTPEDQRTGFTAPRGVAKRAGPSVYVTLLVARMGIILV